MALHSDHTQAIPPAGERSAGGISGSIAALGTVDWLCLAAAPTFAIMGLLSAFDNDPNIICSTAPAGLPFSGMTVMYLLMGVFHLAPWLRLINAMGNRPPIKG